MMVLFQTRYRENQIFKYENNYSSQLTDLTINQILILEELSKIFTSIDVQRR